MPNAEHAPKTGKAESIISTATTTTSGTEDVTAVTSTSADVSAVAPADVTATPAIVDTTRPKAPTNPHGDPLHSIHDLTHRILHGILGRFHQAEEQ